MGIVTIVIIGAVIYGIIKAVMSSSSSPKQTYQPVSYRTQNTTPNPKPQASEKQEVKAIILKLYKEVIRSMEYCDQLAEHGNAEFYQNIESELLNIEGCIIDFSDNETELYDLISTIEFADEEIKKLTGSDDLGNKTKLEISSAISAYANALDNYDEDLSMKFKIPSAATTYNKPKTKQTTPSAKAKSKALKNPKAEIIRQQGKMTIEGIEVNLWQKHSGVSVGDNDWNKVKSYAELNETSTGELGKVVLSGTMQLPRAEISEIAANLGFKIHANISKKTEFLVIGTRNVSPTKIAKALEVNEKGADIKFVDENTFLEVLAENMN